MSEYMRRTHAQTCKPQTERPMLGPKPMIFSLGGNSASRRWGNCAVSWNLSWEAKAYLPFALETSLFAAGRMNYLWLRLEWKSYKRSMPNLQISPSTGKKGILRISQVPDECKKWNSSHGHGPLFFYYSNQVGICSRDSAAEAELLT